MKNKPICIVIGMLVIFAITAMVTAARTSNVIIIDDDKDCGCGSLLSPPCPADVDGDGTVGTLDVGAIEGAFGSTNPEDLDQFDLDGDGTIGTLDVGACEADFGPCT